MGIAEVLRPERIELNLVAETKEQALQKLVDKLFDTGALTDKEAFLKDVMDRERVSTTGIGSGIAIPHGKSAFVKETTVAIGRTSADLQWDSVDGKPVKLIVLLAVNENDGTMGHVRLLSQMARKLASEESCKLLLSADSAEEIIKIFSE